MTPRDPYEAHEDRTPDELAAIRSFAAALDALMDAPPPGPVVVEDDDLEVTRDAMPILATTASVPVITEREIPAAPVPPPLENGLADRMRGVLRGVLSRTRKKKRPAR